MSEVIEKEAENRPKRTVISITVPGVPLRVNRVIEKYRKKINYERNASFNQMEAYAEFLKEVTKNMPI